MGTTTNYGWPYPEGTDLVISGDDAIEALGQAIDATLDATLDWSSGLVIGNAESAAAIGGAVDFPGVVGLAADFTYAAGVITHTGPSSRLYLIDVEVETQAAASGGVDSSAGLYVNGSQIASSYDRVDAPSGGTITRFVVHRITTPATLDPGAVVSVATGGTAGTLGKTQIRICPMGPA